MLGSPSTSVAVADFRLFVHDVRLIDAGGHETPFELDQDGLWQYQTVALLDFENGTSACANGTSGTNTAIKGTAPAGDYVGLVFKIGVPESLNPLDGSITPSPLNLSAL